MELLKNHIPCKCLSCGIFFQSPNIARGGGITFTNCATNCPRCGALAKILDGTTTQEGFYKTKEIISFIKEIRDENKLTTISECLNAANDNISADSLTKNLTKIDERFNNFSEHFSSIPQEKLSIYITTLCTIITAIITSLNFFKDNPIDELVKIEKEKFSFEKSQASGDDTLYDQTNEKIKKLEQQLEQLFHESERFEKKKQIKGNLRNKPCPCGSGKKRL